ncbi:4'-phosphopantetheinyl transferase, partial [Streptomyces sp. SID2131]|nr:4'-phosphopantetheinyl transferase [Streptomyces sp. SID2131]
MIATLLPPPVSVAEAFEDPPGLALLGPEREAVRTAAPKRLAEFTTA